MTWTSASPSPAVGSGNSSKRGGWPNARRTAACISGLLPEIPQGDAGPGHPEQQQRPRHERGRRQGAVQEQVADAGDHQRHGQQPSRVPQPARQHPGAVNQRGAGPGHRRQGEHLDAVQAVDRREQEPGPAGVAEQDYPAGERKPDGALEQRHDGRADTGHHRGPGELLGTATAGGLPQRQDHDGQGDRGHAMDQQRLDHCHAPVAGVGGDHPAAGGGHIRIRRPHAQPYRPGRRVGDARHRRRGDHPATATPGRSGRFGLRSHLDPLVSWASSARIQGRDQTGRRSRPAAKPEWCHQGSTRSSERECTRLCWRRRERIHEAGGRPAGWGRPRLRRPLGRARDPDASCGRRVLAR